MTLTDYLQSHAERLPVEFGAAWARGTALAERGAVRELLQADEHGASAQVLGTRGHLYETSLTLTHPRGRGPTLLSDCSCPVGFECKHAAALIQHLLRASAPTRDAAAMPARSAWEVLADRLPGAEASRDATELVLLVTLDESSRLLFRPLRARHGKDGRWSHPRRVDLESPRVLQLLQTWPMHERLAALSLLGFDGIEYIDGDYWLLFDGPIDAMLQQFFALGIELRLQHLHGPALHVGAARLLQPEWQLAASGDQQLQLRVEPGGVALSNTRFRRYLDGAAGAIGPVLSDLDDHDLAQLRELPAVAPDEVELASDVMTRLFPGGQLPMPKMLATTPASPIAPTAVVLIGGAPYLNRPDLLTQATAHLGFRYGRHEVRAGDRNTELRWRGDDGRIHVLARDVEAEARASQFLARHGFKPGSTHGAGGPAEHWYWNGRLKNGELQDWIAELRRDAAASRIELRSNDEFPIALEPEVGTLDLRVEEDGHDWFSLRLGIEVEGQPVDLVPVLLEALSRPEEQRPDGLRLTLPDGRRVFIANERLTPLLDLVADLETSGDGRIGLPRSRIASLDPSPDWRFLPSKEAAEFIERVRTFRGVELREPPRGFNAELRPYQKEGLAWLDFLQAFQFGGVLADDMGLGKTVQVLAHIAALKQDGVLTQPVLVLCPTSVVDNWRAETVKFAPMLRVRVLAGADRHEHFEALGDVDVVITSYALLWRDIEQLKSQRFALVVFDEAQWLKNASSRSHAAAAQLDAARRLCLTGTPVENHLGELKAQFDLAFPGLLGTHEQFRTRFRQPIERDRDVDAAERLRKRIAPFLLRRRKSEVARDLPARTLIVQPVELEGAQRDLYETVRVQMEARVREALAAQGFGASQITILDALLKLRQICCDPRLIEAGRKAEEPSSAKLDALMELVPTLVDEGRAVLVFSQFTRMLDLIQEALIAHGITYARLDGSTKRREVQVARFQDGQVPVFLISLKAGGVGLNLTRADTVVLYDPWWNPAAEAQAIDRAHRIGQDKPVFIYELQCRGTVEERMHVLKQRKREIADAVLEHGEATLSTLAAEDLLTLFDA
ncbi:MAG TPA: DEAD/DEAH box helicase [Patescibacteria group bacterium]|nr:DEAD/DEAH box helicase [Patescibacteria group bacterium]